MKKKIKPHCSSAVIELEKIHHPRNLNKFETGFQIIQLISAHLLS